eukprot:TRINITY_DN2097_c0_g3_i7.p1 TRINITY_DN2097_c0_g3~~TRINITY_DN2097_c0_g3_i7.p1  ORF type:complete len:149 (-),score=33.76 TRINITY_DN2097_c0_g3_i7:40-486(-)
MSDVPVKRDEVYNSDAITIRLSNQKFASDAHESPSASNNAAESFSRSSSRCEDLADNLDRASEHLSLHKLELRQKHPKDKLEEDKSPRRYSESRLKKRANFRDFVKKTLELGRPGKNFGGKEALSDKIENTIRAVSYTHLTLPTICSV